MKGNKKIIIVAAIAVLMAIAAIFIKPSNKADTHAPRQEQQAQASEETTDVKEQWERLDRIQNLQVAKELINIPPQVQRTDGEERQALPDNLSIYPAPSYVSPDGDSLVYRDGIYKKVGQVERDTRRDTVVIDGRTYVLAE